MITKRTILPISIALGLMLLGRTGFAQRKYHVQVDTSHLNPASTYYTEFTLSDGHVTSLGSPDTNNSVYLDNFNFSGGASGAALSPEIGNASGSTASSVLLADGDPGGIADHAQAFSPGSSLGFDATVMTNVDAGGIPDIFTFFLLDPSQIALSTNAPAETPDTFVRLDITDPTTVGVNSYGNTVVPVLAPDVTEVVTPEPGALALGISGTLCGCLMALRRRLHTKKR
jgi:hypothetical protein